jgi:hypothetical protein
MKHVVVEGLAIAAVLTGSGLALAQEGAPASTPAAHGAAGVDASSAATDGARFRFGVSGGAGFFTAASQAGSAKVSCTYYGADLRFGAQVNNLIGVYVQPTLGYYSANVTGVLAAGGLLGISAAADVTLIDRLFVGAGVGYTVYNNPGGISPLLRIGGYPLMSRSEEKARRKGLMLGMDLRFTSLDGLKTIVMPTFNLGYEAF